MQLSTIFLDTKLCAIDSEKENLSKLIYIIFTDGGGGGCFVHLATVSYTLFSSDSSHRHN